MKLANTIVQYWHTALKKEGIAVTAMDPGWYERRTSGTPAQKLTWKTGFLRTWAGLRLNSHLKFQ